MKILISGDYHIEENSIEELKSITTEICSIKADMLVQLGDLFHCNNLSPAEIVFGCWFAEQVTKNYKSVCVLSGTGRHEWQGNTRIIEYLKFLGIQIRDTTLELITQHEILKLFFGHLMTEQSWFEFGTHQIKLSELQKYDFAFLGHQHSYQELTPGKVFHTGSVRYVSFNEVEDKNKYVMLLDTETKKLELIPLKSPIPMRDVHSVKELDSIAPKTKVRLVISSFEQFKNEINLISQYKDKFFKFGKPKLDFTPTVETPELSKAQPKNVKEIVNKLIAKIEDKEVKEILEKQFKDKC